MQKDYNIYYDYASFAWDVHKVENYPFLVKHPFTDSAFAAIAKNPEKVTENKVINILESESKAPLKAARRC